LTRLPTKLASGNFSDAPHDAHAMEIPAMTQPSLNHEESKNLRYDAGPQIVLKDSLWSGRPEQGKKTIAVLEMY